MALTDENGSSMVMPVGPINSGSGGGFGGFGGDGWWVLILFLLLGGGMWGGGFGGGFDGGLYPWMNNSQNINSGFRDQMLNENIGGIRDGIYGISNQLCNGFAGTTSAITGAQNAITQQMYSNTIADLERSFGIQSQLQNCCCENRASIADLKYTIATEACADRAAVTDALRDVLSATTAQTQTILDKMCQQEIDNLKSQNIALQNQVNMQALAASQAAQTAALVADNTAQTQYIVNRVAPYPIPAYTVANPVTPAV